jgi:FAD/FMN-containing dehydrogenase
MGVVTWITMRAELKPSVEKTFLLGSDSLNEIIPYVYEVQRPWLGEHSFILDRTCAATLMCSGDKQNFEKIRESLPAFICLQNIAGFDRLPKERVDYQLKDIRQIAKRHGLSMDLAIGAISAGNLLKVATNPSENGDWRRASAGHCLSIFFLTTLDRVPDMLKTFAEATKESNLDEKRIGSYIQPVVQNHACHVEFIFPFSDESHDDVEKLKRFEREVVQRLVREGAFFSRPYGRSQEIAFEQNPSNYDLLKNMKKIFDPNRVLNRGKWGL